MVAVKVTRMSASFMPACPREDARLTRPRFAFGEDLLVAVRADLAALLAAGERPEALDGLGMLAVEAVFLQRLFGDGFRHCNRTLGIMKRPRDAARADLCGKECIPVQLRIRKTGFVIGEYMLRFCEHVVSGSHLYPLPPALAILKKTPDNIHPDVPLYGVSKIRAVACCSPTVHSFGPRKRRGGEIFCMGWEPFAVA